MTFKQFEKKLRLQVLCSMLMFYLLFHIYSKDTIICVMSDVFTAFYAGLVVFTCLGFMAKEAGVPVQEVAKASGRVHNVINITDHHWSSLVITGHQWSSLVITGHHWSSLVITGHHGSSLVITGHHWPALVITGHHWPALVSTGQHFVLNSTMGCT